MDKCSFNVKKGLESLVIVCRYLNVDVCGDTNINLLALEIFYLTSGRGTDLSVLKEFQEQVDFMVDNQMETSGYCNEGLTRDGIKYVGKFNDQGHKKMKTIAKHIKNCPLFSQICRKIQEYMERNMGETTPHLHKLFGHF